MLKEHLTTFPELGNEHVSQSRHAPKTGMTGNRGGGNVGLGAPLVLAQWPPRNIFYFWI